MHYISRGYIFIFVVLLSLFSLTTYCAVSSELFTNKIISPLITQGNVLLWSSSDFNLYQGDIAYFEDGVLHNLNGPAIVRATGADEYWIWGFKVSFSDYTELKELAEMLPHGLRTVFMNDEIHVLPSFDDQYESYRDGFLENDFGPAVVSQSGSKVWMKGGQVTRSNGPAIEFSDGTKWYIVDGHFSCVSGPAVAHANGISDSYFVDGFQVSN